MRGLQSFLDLPIRFQPVGRPPRSAAAVIGWGLKGVALRARAAALRYGVPYLALEDGFLRSIVPGSAEGPLSLAVDDLGVYYDAHAASRLEEQIAREHTDAERERGAALAALWRHERVSKYNHAREWQPARFVIGQPEHDDGRPHEVAHLAQKFGKEPHVVFGLMNEPHDMPAAAWAKSAQAAIDAIRATGACNLLLVPGVNWTGAHSWTKDSEHGVNAQTMRAIRDKGAHAFEFHQYLDADSSGTSGQCREKDEVLAALSVATNWLRENKRKGFLGEFGAGDSEQCRKGLDAMLEHMADNADVWTGWAYWAAGAWWPKDYPLSIEPKDGEERAQMKTLAKWMGGALPNACPVPQKRKK